MNTAKNTEDFLEQYFADQSACSGTFNRRMLGVFLDVGCGDGTFLDDLLTLADAQEVWGIDIDEDALSEARLFMNRAGIHFRYHIASSLNSDLPACFFNTISFRDLLHHLAGGSFSHEPPPRARGLIQRHFREMDRLLRPGGRFIISECIVDDDPPPARAAAIMLHNLKSEIDTRHGINHSYSFCARTLRTLLANILTERGYAIEACAVVNEADAHAEDNADAEADADEQARCNYFAASLARLADAPGCSEFLHEARQRLLNIQAAIHRHGLLPQRRLMLIARKSPAHFYCQ